MLDFIDKSDTSFYSIIMGGEHGEGRVVTNFHFLPGTSGTRRSRVPRASNPLELCTLNGAIYYLIVQPENSVFIVFSEDTFACSLCSY